MRDSKYWRDRFKQLEIAQNDQSIEKSREVQEQFDRSLHAIDGKINAWYQRIAKNNNISMTEAKKLLSDKELKEFKWNVDDYIQYAKENEINGAWEKQLENASARVHISRLEALKIETQQELEKLYGNITDSIDKHIANTYANDFYHTAYEVQKGIGVGSRLQRLNPDVVEKIVCKPWAVDEKNFSDRIWENKTKLINNMHNSLSRMCITGEAPDRAIAEIAKSMGVSKSQASRLVMTESAAFSNKARKDCMKELDVEEFEVVETLDSSTCEFCARMDGKHYAMNLFEIGVTAPPFHPNCRGCTCPYFNDEFTVGEERAARGKDGKTYYVPSDMTYEDWKKAFVDGKSDVGLKEVPLKKQTSNSIREDAQKKNDDFVPAKTIEEAQEYAKQFCNDGFMAKTFKGKIDYKGISLENANAINKALANAYGNMELEKISGIKIVSPTSALGKKAFKDGSDAVFSYSPIEHGIFANKDILKNQKTFEEYAKKSKDAWNTVMENIDSLSGSQKELALLYKEAGRSLVDGDTIEGMFTHELGHHVQWTLLDTSTNNSVGSNMKKYAPNISGYANASKSEYLAESFSAYMKGERDILDPEYVKYMDKHSIT